MLKTTVAKWGLRKNLRNDLPNKSVITSFHFVSKETSAVTSTKNKSLHIFEEI